MTKLFTAIFALFFAAGCTHHYTSRSAYAPAFAPAYASNVRYQTYHPGYGSSTTYVAPSDMQRGHVVARVEAYDDTQTDPDLDGWDQRRYYGGRYRDNRYFVDQAYAFRPGGTTRTVYVMERGEPVSRVVNVDVNNRPYEWVNGRRYYLNEYSYTYPRRYYAGR